ncbi:MAG: D-alanyl-D-alanine carboxypeptidase/D-alanyl-D-alanine-endopeptidase [Deltaproteobacteria bacterium]|nr:D-alanyl-D-alanine carboxypeptidase/D-alanyl-D-alanine-endopeptidase [Deltaproteobacteria bacterium]
MRGTTLFGALAIFLGCTLSSSSAAKGSDAQVWLQRELNKLATDSRLGAAHVGVVVVRAGDGAELYTREPDRLVSVASNVKIITSTAALALLGSEFRFKTAVYAPGYKGGKVVEGNLFLKGFGDPSLRMGDLDRLAALVREMGIEHVKGALVLDESYFDKHRLPPCFESRRTDAYYRPVVGALSLEENTIAIRVRGARKPGQPATVVVMPRTRYVKVDNKMMTVNRRRRMRLGLSTVRRGQSTVVLARGRVRVGYEGRWYRKRVAHAGTYTGATFLEALTRRGVKIDKKRLRRGRVPKKSRSVAEIHSRALGDLTRRLNKVSSNFMAEQLLKVMGAETFGAPATWSKGLKAVEQYLAKLGVPAGSYTLKNGSGLYDASALTPRQIVKVLRAAYGDFRYSADFLSSLAIAGIDGTLAHRFIGSGAERYVRAKTGTLAKVVALSGFAAASAGKKRQPLLFSLLITDLPNGRISEAREVVDAMARILVTYLER